MILATIRTLAVAVALMAVTSPQAQAQPGPGCPADPGAAIAAACPCDGGGQGWRNHGKYVTCVVRFRNDLRKQGCLTRETERQIARCAARSNCGKEGATLCCVYDTSATCSSPDGITPGACSDDATRTCLTATDCITASGPVITRRAETCTNRGGTPIGGGSVCSACPIPPPAP